MGLRVHFTDSKMHSFYVNPNHIYTTDTMYKIDNCWEYTVYHRDLSLIHWNVLSVNEIQSEIGRASCRERV